MDDYYGVMDDTVDFDEYEKDFFKFYKMITHIYIKFKYLEGRNHTLREYYELNENIKKSYEIEIQSLKREIHEIKHTWVKQ